MLFVDRWVHHELALLGSAERNRSEFSSDLELVQHGAVQRRRHLIVLSPGLGEELHVLHVGNDHR